MRALESGKPAKSGKQPPAELQFQSFDPRLQRFYAYWRERRGARRFPARRDLDPADFTYLLGYVMLMDVHREPLRFRFRLHGSELVRHGGYDMTGKWIEDLQGEENRRALRERCLSLLETGQPQFVRSQRRLDGRLMRFEAVWVPLSDDGQTINMLMRALCYRDAPPLPVAEPFHESGALP